MTAIDDTELAEVDRASVEVLLAEHGWRRHETEHAVVWEAEQADDDGRPIRLFLPRAAPRRVPRFAAQAVELVAALEELDPRTLLVALQATDRDVLAVTVAGLDVDDRQGLSLSSAPVVVGCLHDLVVHTASTEEEPQAALGRARKRGTELAKDWVFAHTYRGSYGLTLRGPVLVPDPQGALEDRGPFPRRVAARLQRGLQHVQDSAEARDLGPLLDGYTDGLNANALEVVGRLLNAVPGARFRFVTAWSPRVEGAPLTRTVELGESAVPYVERAAVVLRPTGDTAERTIAGYVVRLSASPSDEPGMHGERRVELRVIDDPVLAGRNVRITLGEHEYRMACDVHRDGARVRVQGRLVRDGKVLTLEAPSALRTVEEGNSR